MAEVEWNDIEWLKVEATEDGVVLATGVVLKTAVEWCSEGLLEVSFRE